MPERITIVGNDFTYDFENCNEAFCSETIIDLDAQLPQLGLLVEKSPSCGQTVTFTCQSAPITVNCIFFAGKSVFCSKACANSISVMHSEVEWNFWFVNFLWWNPVQKQEFCIPLHFLGIKDLKKIEKGQRNFWRPHQRPDREKSWIFIIFSPNYNQLVLIIWAIPLVWPSRP